MTLTSLCCLASRGYYRVHQRINYSYSLSIHYKLGFCYSYRYFCYEEM